MRLQPETLETRNLLAGDLAAVDEVCVPGNTGHTSGYACQLVLFEEQLITGDINADGYVDSSDLMDVMAQGKYEQAATWSQGDMNHDGVFNSDDLLEIMAAGWYEQGPTALNFYSSYVHQAEQRRIHYHASAPLTPWQAASDINEDGKCDVWDAYDYYYQNAEVLAPYLEAGSEYLRYSPADIERDWGPR